MDNKAPTLLFGLQVAIVAMLILLGLAWAVTVMFPVEIRIVPARTGGGPPPMTTQWVNAPVAR